MPNLSVGTWSSGYIGSATEHDDYSVYLSAGTNYDFYAANLSVDTVLTLYNPSGTQVRYNDDGGWGVDSFIDDYTAPSSGWYTLRADGYSSDTGSYVVGAHVDYEQIDTPLA
jgi:serralysin